MACQQAALLGTGTCGNEAGRRTTCRCPHFRLRLDFFKLSKQVSFDGARRIPLLRQMNQCPVVFCGMFEVIPVRKCRRRSHYVSVPIPPYPRSSLDEGPGSPLFSERGRARHCSDAIATGRVGKAVGDFTARRRSAEVRLGKTSVAKRHAFKKRTVFTTRWRTHVSGGGATRGMRAECVPMRRGGFKTSASPQ